MFSSLFRWFGHVAGRRSSGRPARPARRFTPRLEALGERLLPGGAAGGVADIVSVRPAAGANVAVGQIMPFGGKPGVNGGGFTGIILLN
jgi:hypothetical protein